MFLLAALLASTVAALASPSADTACGLQAGSLSIVAVRTSGATSGTKALELLALAPLPAGCCFSVTDQGVLADGSALRVSSEGTLTFTVGTLGIDAGATIAWQEETEAAGGSGSGDGGVWRKTGGFLMSSAGEQLLVFDGGPAAGGLTAPLFHLSYGGAFDADATSSTSSALAPGLSAAHVALPTRKNYRYTAQRSGTAAQLLAAIVLPSSWYGSNDPEAGTFQSTGPFVVSRGPTQPLKPTPSLTPAPPTPPPLPNRVALSSTDLFYSSVDWRVAHRGAAGVAELRTSLATLLRNTHRRVSYADARQALQEADAANATHIRLFYTGELIPRAWDGGKSWNREHLFPQSYMGDHAGPDHSDLHALRAARPGVNSARGNKWFAECSHDNGSGDGCTRVPAWSGGPADSGYDSESFQPSASVRGDIARGLFYMALRYPGGPSAEADTLGLTLSDTPDMGAHRMGRLADLLRWHAADPVSADEVRRNTVVARPTQQANRNPFVDVPALADLFFGSGVPAVAPGCVASEGGALLCEEDLKVTRVRQCGGDGASAEELRDLAPALTAAELREQSSVARAQGGGAFCFCLHLAGGNDSGGGGSTVDDATAVADAVGKSTVCSASSGSGGVVAYRGVKPALWEGRIQAARAAQHERVCFCS